MFNTSKENLVSSLLWFVLVTISVPLGYALGDSLTRNTSDANGTAGLGIIALLLVIGVVLGFGQWIALNRSLKVGWAWIPATAIGFSFGCAVSYLIIAFVVEGLLNLNTYSGVFEWVEFAAMFMGAGILTGALQWFALERVEQMSQTWMFISGLSFAVSFVLASLITQFLWIGYEFIGIHFAIVFGLVLGLLTTISAERLILRPGHQEP